jgi:hypothetical protein
MSGKLDKKTFDKLVDIVLEHGRTPRKDLYEYPYNEFESRDLIAKAETAVKRIIKVINDAEQSKS